MASAWLPSCSPQWEIRIPVEIRQINFVSFLDTGSDRGSFASRAAELARALKTDVTSVS